jgi:hypothetical protein
VPPPDLDDGRDVQRVHDLGRVDERQPRRLRVPVDGDEPDAERLQVRERAPLVPPGADEEHRRSSRRVITAAYQA